jgi:methylthioribose-1-phosphate isomerase
MDHKKKSRTRSVVDETALPAATGRRMLVRVLPALAVAAGVLVFQAVRSDRRAHDDGPVLSAAERSTRALLSERTAAHLRALRPR